jgi:hypothetical protein
VRKTAPARINPHQYPAGPNDWKPYSWLHPRKIARCIISEGTK